MPCSPKGSLKQKKSTEGKGSKGDSKSLENVLPISECAERLQDGVGFLGAAGWKSGTKIKLATLSDEYDSVVTTAALRSAGLEHKVVSFEVKVRNDYTPQMTNCWLGVSSFEVIGTVTADVRVQLESETDRTGLVEFTHRLTLLRDVCFRVVCKA